MQRLNAYLVALTQSGIVSDAEVYADGCFHFRDGDNHYTGQVTPRGYVLSCNGRASRVITNKPLALVCKAIASSVFGTSRQYKVGDRVYQSVSVYPVKRLDNVVVFSSKTGKKFAIKSSSSLVTLGLYDLLYNQNSEHSILMLPVLWGDTPEVEYIHNSLDLLRPYMVSLKSSKLQRGCYHGSDYSRPVKASRVRHLVKANRLIGDFSRPYSESPSFGDIMSRGRTIVYSSPKGYTLRSCLDIDGLTYAFAARVSPSRKLVSAIASSAGTDEYGFEAGIEVEDSTVLKALADLVGETYEDITDAIFDTMDTIGFGEEDVSETVMADIDVPLLEFDSEETGSDFITPDLEFEGEEDVLDSVEEFDSEEFIESGESVEEIEARFKMGIKSCIRRVVRL